MFREKLKLKSEIPTSVDILAVACSEGPLSARGMTRGTPDFDPGAK